MGFCHDFIHGEYYEDDFTGETMSIGEYYRRKHEAELNRKCQQYILIEKCESIINQTRFFCDFSRWHYASDEKKPKGIVILSENEYLYNDKKTCYYRAYDGDHYLFLKVIANKRLEFEKVEEVCGFLLGTKKGHGVLYTQEQFKKEFLT